MSGSQHNPNGRQAQLGAGWSPLQLQMANLLARAPQAHMASERGVTWHTPTPPPHLYHVPAPSPPDPLQAMKNASGNTVFRHTATPPELYRHTPTPPDKHIMRHTPSPGDVKTGAPLPAVDIYPHLGPARDKLVRAEELLAYARGVDLSLGSRANGAAPALSVRDAPTINSLLGRGGGAGAGARRVDSLLERLAGAPPSPHSVIVHPRAMPTPSPPSSNEDSADSFGAAPGSKRKRKPERTVRVPVPPLPAPAPPPPHNDAPPTSPLAQPSPDAAAVRAERLHVGAENGHPAAGASPPRVAAVQPAAHRAATPPPPATTGVTPPPHPANVSSPRAHPDSASSPCPQPATASSPRQHPAGVTPPPADTAPAPALADRRSVPEPAAAQDTSAAQIDRAENSSRRKTRSGSAETIAEIAAMIAGGSGAPAPAPPAPAPALSADKLESVLASPEPAPLKSASPEERAAPAAAFVEVENQLEKMFAGLEEPHAASDRENPPVKGSAPPSKRRKSAPGRGREAPPRRKGPRKKQGTKHAQKEAKETPAKEGREGYDSGSNASSGRSRGPYIQIRGPRASPVSVCVMNAAAGEEEERGARRRGGAVRRRGLHASTLGLRYDAATRDLTWLCAFCGRGPHAAALGDLFGPYDELWVHADCAVWAPGVVAAGARVWGLPAAVAAAAAERCAACSRLAAPLACAARGCAARAHLPCARTAAWLLDESDFRALCPAHRH